MGAERRPSFFMISIAIDSIVPVRASASDRAEQVSELLFGEQVTILETNGNWAQIECMHDRYRGFADIRMFEPVNARRSHLCRLGSPTNAVLDETPIMLPKGALLPQNASTSSFVSIGHKTLHLPKDRLYFETMNSAPSPADVMRYAESFLGTPYRWGGRSNYGIDCSGLVQQVYASLGIQLPRDAWQQAEIGKSVTYLKRQPADLAFFNNNEGKITHVGIVGKGHDIVHASVRVRKDLLFSTGVYSPEYRKETHSLYLIRRIL